MRIRNIFPFFPLILLTFFTIGCNTERDSTSTSIVTEKTEITKYRVGGSGNYQNIQNAIDAAPSGSTILVAAGTYNENICIRNPKNVKVQGGWDTSFSFQDNNASLTTIDCQGKGPAIEI